MSTTAPGYDQQTGMPAGGVAGAKRVGTITAKRITGPFDVRGRNFVDHIEDGWLCTDEKGYFFGVENADITGAVQVPPALFTDSVASMSAATESVAYDQAVTPPSNSGGALTSASVNFSGSGGLAVYDGLTLNLSNLADLRLAGTPATNSPRYAYFEILFVWDDGRSVVQRYGMTVAAGA